MSPISDPVARAPRRPACWAAVLAWGVVALALTVVPSVAPAVGQEQPDACAEADLIVDVVGSSSARLALETLGQALCSEAGVVANYTDVTSKGGRDSIIDGSAFFGLTSLPFTTEEADLLEAEERGVVLVPMIAGSAVCTYWDVRDGSPELSGKRFPDLRLSRSFVARMLGGASPDTSDAGLAEANEDNEGYPRPAPFLNLEFYVRSGTSAVTYELGRWISQDAEATAEFDEEGADRYPPEVDLPFEEMPVIQEDAPQIVADYATMFSRMTTAQASLSFACMDGATALSDSRPDSPTVETVNRAWLDNAAGEYVFPSDEAVTEALAAMLPNGDGTFRPDPELESDTAYGLPIVTYAALATCGMDEPDRDAMEAVVDYLIDEGQGAMPDGNVAMPDAVAAVATRRLADWKRVVTVGECGADPTPPTTEPPTTTAPTTLPLDPGTTTIPFVDPGPGDLPPVDGSGGGGGGESASGVVPDSGFTGTPVDDNVAAPPVEDVAPSDVAAPTAVAEAADAGPVGPVAKVVAMARGSSAVPPLAILIAGLAALVVGPVLQTGDAMGRAASLPATARRWFRRLRP